jgi:hypothetical protein
MGGDDPDRVWIPLLRRDPRVRPELRGIEGVEVVLDRGIGTSLHEPAQDVAERRERVHVALALGVVDEVAEARRGGPDPEEHSVGAEMGRLLGNASDQGAEPLHRLVQVGGQELLGLDQPPERAAAEVCLPAEAAQAVRIQAAQRRDQQPLDDVVAELLAVDVPEEVDHRAVGGLGGDGGGLGHHHEWDAVTRQGMSQRGQVLPVPADHDRHLLPRNVLVYPEPQQLVRHGVGLLAGMGELADLDPRRGRLGRR